MSTQTFDKVPPVFSFQRLMLVSDGAFYNLINGAYENNPLAVIRHGLRGTQNVSDSAGDAARNANREVSNIQQTETAKTAHNAQAAVVKFGIRLLDLKHSLFACAADDVQTTNAVRESVMRFVERAKPSKGLTEVSCRVARNIANGSWLWRNRTAATSIKVEVFLEGQKAPMATFDALNIPVNHFNDYSEAELAVAAVLASGLRGDLTTSMEIVATIDFGVRGAVEVFPSQAYIENKPDGFARPLYKLAGSDLSRAREDSTEGVRVMGHAGLRDQKISNRLRTIDTWYEDFEQVGKPIPVEPNGASLEFMQFFRSDRKGDSTTSLFSRLNTLEPDTQEGMFAIASMIRGGVIVSKSDKKSKKAAE